MAGVVGTSWALLRAVRAERRVAAEAVEARRQTAIAEAVNGFLNKDLLAAVVPSANAGPGQGRHDAAGTRRGRRTDRQGVTRSGDVSRPNRSSKRRFASRSDDTYRELGAYAAAEPHLRRAVELRRGALGAGHQETARVMNQLARPLLAAGALRSGRAGVSPGLRGEPAHARATITWIRWRTR